MIKLDSYKYIDKDLKDLENKYLFGDSDEIKSIDFSLYFLGNQFYYYIVTEENIDIFEQIESSATIKEEMEGDRCLFFKVDECDLLVFNSSEFMFLITDNYNKKELENLIETLI